MRREEANTGMVRGSRRKRGWPRLPPERRKRHVSCYLAPEIVDGLDRIAPERRMTRNQGAVAILSEQVATVSDAGDRGAGSVMTDG